ncbi:TrkH family potassium uptake protein [Halarchaeum sp. CBA1220]|uniref:TrkH family potassium uptake protein n=1 Tax=Halarchaeum sp. CBA1220 TaxID=1853682 RepID=UPI000F3A9389|nr:TrkH family potassium uptake protein [Halarchaeum sp. CBA1220]QLC34510.1 TrkH family potassium uptake protein [Halarchaeum sp. CBA1220]
MSGILRVDWRASLSLVGSILKYLAVPLCVPVVVALYYGDGGLPAFLLTIAVTLGVGTALERLDDDPDIGTREGFLMVALSWLLVAAIGAIPYLVEAHGVPGVVAPTHPESTLGNPANALFESMSGFTTTGATVLGSISFDAHSRAMMMWRQQTQWLGGMGIVVLAVAILPKLSVGGAQLMDAEAPGPGLEKLTPKIAETARTLWVLYVGLTALEIAILYGLHLLGPVVGTPLAPKMTFYNAVAHGLTTMPTGGFSPMARSIEAFSAVVQWVIVPFMVAAGVNFALFWHFVKGERHHVREDAEFRAYAGVFAVATAVLGVLLYTDPGLASVANVGRITGAIEPSLRHAAFQAAAIVTTTGYASMDFNAWGTPAKYALLVLMFVGGSAGSTGGGIKIVRWLVVLKSVRREFFTTIHPDAVKPVRLGGQVVDESAVRGIQAFTLLYIVLFALASVLVIWNGAAVEGGMTVLEGVSAAASTLGNVGPGFGAFGPMNSYLPFPNSTKLLMVGLMWVGRLEIFPVLILLTRSYWSS